MTNRRFLSVVVLASTSALLCCLSLGCAWALYPVKVPKWSAAPVRIRLPKLSWGRSMPELEFSPDSKYIGVHLLPWHQAGNKAAGVIRVYDEKGQLVPGAVDKRDALVGEYFRMFPGIAWRTHFADFVRDAGERFGTWWGFTPDYKSEARLVSSRKDRFPYGEIWTAQFWQLAPARKLMWSTEFPDVIRSLKLVSFFHREGKEYVLLAFAGIRGGVVLSREDGRVVERLTYGPIETEKDRRAYKRKFDLGSVRDSSLDFSPCVFAFEPSLRLLACGAFCGRRVRVLSMDTTHKVVFEANTNDHPYRPRGGVWCVTGLRFAGDKYLIVDYRFGGRLTSLFLDPTDIFEVGTWKRVWHENSLTISHVTLSPDGKKMALIRGKDWLEIGPFVPEPDEKARR